MKKLLLILFIALITGQAAESPPYIRFVVFKSIGIDPYFRLWQASCTVESHNDPKAYNPIEHATGIVQVRPIRLKDYNQRTGKHYKLSDMYDIKISKEVYYYYADMGGLDLEYIARSWNGSGVKTLKYWRKIKSEMQK